MLISRISDIVVDKQGFIWLVSVKGIQFWDGLRFNTLIANIDSDSEFTKIYKHPEQGIYYLTSTKLFHLTLDSKTPKLVFEKTESMPDISLILDQSKGKDLLIVGDSIFQIRLNNNVSFLNTSPIKYYGKSSRYVFRIRENKDTIIYDYLSGISQINLKDCHNKSGINSPHSKAFEWNEDCYYLSNQGLEVNNELFRFPDNATGRYHFAMLKRSATKLLVGMDNRLFEFDMDNRRWSGEFVNSENHALLEKGFIDKILIDNFKNIWIVTVNNGLLKIHENKSFRYFGKKDKSENFVKNLALNKSKNQILIACLNRGLFVYDTLGNFSQEVFNPLDKSSLSDIIGVYALSENEYLYNLYGDSSLYKLQFDINGDYAVRNIGVKKSKYSYYQTVVSVPDERLVFGFDNIVVYNKELNKIEKYQSLSTQKFCGLYHNEVIFFGSENEILSLNYPSLSIREAIKVKDFGFVRGMLVKNNNEIYIAGDAGLAILSLIDNSYRLIYSDATIYSLTKDEEGVLWMGTDKGLIARNESNHFTLYLPEDGIQSFEFNTDAFAKDEQGELYFGGTNGVSSFYPNKMLKEERELFLFFKSVSVNAEEWMVNNIQNSSIKLNLKHQENSVMIDLGLLGDFESDYYHYSYRIKGQAKEWIQNGNLSKFVFDLSAGEHELEFKANIPHDNTNAQFLKANIQISQAWWNSKPFYFGIGCFLALLAYFIFYFINKHKLQKAQYEWDVKYKLQEERISLSRDIHDHIGSQLSYLVSSIDDLESDRKSEKEKVNHLSQFSRKIIDDLRSLIWVLNKDEISVEELVLKILDLIQIIQNAQDNISIQFEAIYNEAEPEILESRVAGQLFRVVQELFHNTMKHAFATEIRLNLNMLTNSLQLDYQDNGKGFIREKIELGYGLRNIETRLKEIDGKMIFHSEKQKGVRYQFVIPVYTKNSV